MEKLCLNPKDLLFYTCTGGIQSKVDMLIVHLPTGKEVSGTGNNVSKLKDELINDLICLMLDKTNQTKR